MLTFNASTPRATPNEAASPRAGAPIPTPVPAPASNRDPAGFASLLRQTRAAPAPHAAPPEPVPASNAGARASARPPEPASTPEPGADANAAHGSALANGRANAPLQGKPRDSANAAAAPRGAKPAGEAPSAGRGSATEHDKSDSATAATTNQTAANAALDPALLHWLASQKPGTTATDPAVPAAAVTGTGEPGGAAPGQLAADPKADADLNAKATQGKPQLGVAAGEAGVAAVLAEQHHADKPLKSPVDATAGFKDILTAAAAFAPPVATQRAAAAPLAVAIATPVTAPDFAQSLGVQMSVLARGGVQHAELHLNPAEMGPVSVQIAMDGTQARVDFGADVAATRHAIEAGLPELASALRDAGFTLAGGGVSQHSRGRGDGGGGDASSDSGTRRPAGADGADRIDASGRAARRVVRLGGVDLYA